MAHKTQTVAEAVEKLSPHQTCRLIAPDKDDTKIVADWYQQVSAEVKAGKIRVLDKKIDTAYHGMVFAVIIEKL